MIVRDQYVSYGHDVHLNTRMFSNPTPDTTAPESGACTKHVFTV